MQAPGFKVFHVQDIDFRSHCLLLSMCLATIVDWSNKHPSHFPIFITINAKADFIDRPGFVRPLEFTAQAWDALDQEITAAMGSRLLRPDDLRKGQSTLREAVLAGWPLLDEVRGKFLFVLDDSAAKKQSYMNGHPSLSGRAMFVDAAESEPEAAIRIVNDPIGRGDYIRSLVNEGFIVRTRSDADTKEARTGDGSRLKAALESGAQIVSTDYYVGDERFGTGFVVRLPATARCNPGLREPCLLSDQPD